MTSWGTSATAAGRSAARLLGLPPIPLRAPPRRPGRRPQPPRAARSWILRPRRAAARSRSWRRASWPPSPLLPRPTTFYPRRWRRRVRMRAVPLWPPLPPSPSPWTSTGRLRGRGLLRLPPHRPPLRPAAMRQRRRPRRPPRLGTTLSPRPTRWNRPRQPRPPKPGSTTGASPWRATCFPCTYRTSTRRRARPTSSGGCPPLAAVQSPAAPPSPTSSGTFS